MPVEAAPVEEFLQRLARAVRQFHTYPAVSPMCADAVIACHNALGALDGHERLTVRVTPDALTVDRTRCASAIVAHELARRLHAAHVAALEIDLVAMPRHLARLCVHLAGTGAAARARTTLAELLVEDGVETIVAVMAQRPEVLDVGVPGLPARDLVGREQQRRESWGRAGAPTFLYPPDKAWVRMDPGTALDEVSLVDLAILVNDPGELAMMLLRLTDDDPAGPEDRATALERKFSDIAMLFSSLDPRLARVMFGNLARAVLGLDPPRRQDLLRRTILPGLLDGRADGAVLRDFPDVDLVDSLLLLLDLETAAPEVVATALHRLDLPGERRDALAPMLDTRLRDTTREPADRVRQREIDRLAGGLIRVDSAPGKDFSEFTAFDLSIDERTAAALTDARDAVVSARARSARLDLSAHLVRLQPNPTVAQTLVRQAMLLFGELYRESRWQELGAWAAKYNGVAAGLRTSRPEVAAAIDDGLAAFCVPVRIAELAELYDRGADGRAVANVVIDAFDASLVSGMLTLLGDPAWQSKTGVVISMMCEHAVRLAPALADGLGSSPAATARGIIKVLGFAGSGYESIIDEQLEHGDEQTSREALRALARIGSPEAAAFVAARVGAGRIEKRAAAEEALWRFPPAHARAQVRELLGRRDFVVEHPDVASRLLTRAASTGPGRDGLQAVLAGIEPLRFRFWNPRLVKVALKARELRTR